MAAFKSGTSWLVVVIGVNEEVHVGAHVVNGTGLLGTSWTGDGGADFIFLVMPTDRNASSSSLLGSVKMDVWVLNLRKVSRNPTTKHVKSS